MQMILVAAIGAVCVAGAAQAQTARPVTTCTAPAGQSFFVDRGSAGSWQADGLSWGAITVLRTTFGEYDVHIRDTLDSFTARGDGATVSVAPGATDRAFTLTAMYPLGTVETYAFMLDSAGTGVLVWTAIRRQPTGGVRGSVFTAACKAP